MDKHRLEALVARGCSLEQIGREFEREPSTVAYWMKKHGLQAANRDRHLARGGIAEDVLHDHVDRGETIAEIAEAVGMSKATVRHWLRRYGLRTKHGVGRRMRPEAERALSEGKRQVLMTCVRHGLTEFRLDGRRTFRCPRCRAERVMRRRRKIKAILVNEAGGRCVLCGFDRSPQALHFHHLKPHEKLFAVSRHGETRSIARARAEAAKCVLLCANCHAAVEAGSMTVP